MTPRGGIALVSASSDFPSMRRRRLEQERLQVGLIFEDPGKPLSVTSEWRLPLKSSAANARCDGNRFGVAQH
jgi:hypothetical protein